MRDGYARERAKRVERELSMEERTKYKRGRSQYERELSMRQREL